MKGVLWDLDGVLVDTGDLHYHTWEQILAERGISLNPELFRPTFGMKNAEFLPQWLGRPLEPQEIADISAAKEARFRQNARGQVRALPGIHRWLKQFAEWGFRQAVASSADLENIHVLVDELGIRGYFEALVSASAFPGKPDPAVFVEAARRIALPVDHCLVIEDSVVGIQAAKGGRMKCIAVATTYPPGELGLADLVVDRLENLTVGQVSALLGAQPGT